MIFINFDEIPIYYDMARDSTYHYKGEKQITVLSHTASQHRLTACLASTSDGDVLNPLIISRYKPLINNKKKISRTIPKKAENYKNSVDPLMVRFNVTGFNNEVIF